MKTGISGRAAYGRVRQWSRGALAWSAFFACTCAAWAQDNEHIYQTYADSVSAAQRREPLGDQAFGEKIALFSGSTEFTITDIALPGNNALPVSLGRRFVIQDRNQYRDRVWLSNLGGFDDWDIEVPYLEGTFPSRFGWIVASPDDQQPHAPSSSISVIACGKLLPVSVTVMTPAAIACLPRGGQMTQLPVTTMHRTANCFMPKTIAPASVATTFT